MMPRRDFHFAGHATRVEAAEAPLAWLHEFVAPQFASRDTEAPDRTVSLIVDAREHARLAARGPHAQGGTRACFTLDTGIVRGHIWDAPDPSQVVLDEEREVFYRRWPDEPTRVEVIAARDGVDARLALLRVLREYAMLHATRAGWLILHAAAAAIDGHALVIAGPKQAGKTTLLLHALHNESGAYVANDRLAISADPSGLTAYGIPTIVIIRKASTAWFPDLEARLAGARYHYRHRLAERDAGQEDAASTPATTWSLSPGQLCHLLDVESRASARVKAVVFPSVGVARGSIRFDELSPERALDSWRRTLLRAIPSGGMFAISPDGAAPPDEDIVVLATRLAARVPSFSCQLGPDAYRDGAAMRALISNRAATRAGAHPFRID
jgi:hypothetical protein